MWNVNNDDGSWGIAAVSYAKQMGREVRGFTKVKMKEIKLQSTKYGKAKQIEAHMKHIWWSTIYGNNS